MRYFAILSPGETLAECWRVCRKCEGGFEKFNFDAGAWEYDVELLSIYLGEPEVEDITKEQADEIIARIQERQAGVPIGLRRT